MNIVKKLIVLPPFFMFPMLSVSADNALPKLDSVNSVIYEQLDLTSQISLNKLTPITGPEWKIKQVSYSDNDDNYQVDVETLLNDVRLVLAQKENRNIAIDQLFLDDPQASSAKARITVNWADVKQLINPIYLDEHRVNNELTLQEFLLMFPNSAKQPIVEGNAVTYNVMINNVNNEQPSVHFVFQADKLTSLTVKQS